MPPTVRYPGYGSPYAGDYDINEGNPGSLHDDTSQLRSLLPATLNRRNLTLQNLVGQLRGPSFAPLFEAGGVDAAVEGRRGATQRVRSALAARGLMQSGAESTALRGIEKGYGSSVLDAVSQGQMLEDQRKAGLAGSIQKISQDDLGLLDQLQNASLSKYDADVTTELGRLGNGASTAAGIGEVVKLIASLAAGGYGAMSGSFSAGAGGAAGSTGAAGFANNYQMAQGIGNSGGGGAGVGRGAALPYGSAQFGGDQMPTAGRGSGDPNMNSVGLKDSLARRVTTPAGASKELQDQLYYAGVY